MKKHKFLFHKTEEDQHRLDGIDGVLSDVLGERAGVTKVMRLACKVAQEMLINGSLSCPDSFRPDGLVKGNHVKVDLDEHDWARLGAVSAGLGELAGRSNPVTKQSAMRVSLHCAEIWLRDHAAQAERIGNGTLEHLMWYAIVHCSKSGSGIGPSKVIRGLVELSQQYESALPEHDNQHA